MRGKKLTDEFGWDKDLTKKIWCFGPDTMGPNMLLDATKAVQYLSEIKDSCVGAFQWASKEGVMAGRDTASASFASLFVQAAEFRRIVHLPCALCVRLERASFALHCHLLRPVLNVAKRLDARSRHVPTSRLIHAGHARLRL